jgi:hypothetical protein
MELFLIFFIFFSSAIFAAVIMFLFIRDENPLLEMRKFIHIVLTWLISISICVVSLLSITIKMSSHMPEEESQNIENISE